MRINKYILGLAVAVLGGFTSCNTDVESSIYNSNFEHVSFDGKSASVAVSVDETSATIPVTITRGKVTNASTVTFTATASEEGIFTNDANGTVSFEAGKNSATFNVKASNLQKDQSYTYTLKLSDAAILTKDSITGVAQNTTFTITVSRAGDWTSWAKWNSEGTATYIYVNMLALKDPGYEFTYRQSLNNPDKYQFKLANWFYGVDLVLDYDKSTGYVSCPPMYSGYTDSTYGDVWVTDLVNYCGMKGWTVEPGDYGTFDEEQGIIKLPLAYYVSAGSFGYDPEYIYIDGYLRADYSLSAAYFGRLTDASNNDFLLANISFGKDVEYVRYALATESEIDSTAEALVEGGGEKLTEAGQISIPVAESGTYYLVVVAFAGDEAVSADYFKMKFTSSKEKVETWKALYIGTYAYTTRDYSEDQGGGFYSGSHEAVLYQSESDNTRFKIAPWASQTGEEGLIFTMDANGVLTVDNVYTGYTNDTYGELFAIDFVTGEEADMPSTFDSGKGAFYFNLKYYVSAFAVAFVEDTFTITGAIDDAAAKTTKKANRSQSTKALNKYAKLAREYFAPVLKLRQTK